MKRTLIARFEAAAFDPPSSPLRWHRAVASALAILVAVFIAWGFTIIQGEPVRTDFLSFWAAAKLALTGSPALAYDLEAHRAVQTRVVHFDGLLPFPYPPPFLLMVLPFGFVPYGLGFAAFVLVTGGIYLLASRGIAPLAYRVAHPQAFLNGTTAQNGFVTCAIFIGGTGLLPRRPLLGGAILGLLVIKPQLGLLLPVALIAGREWRAIGGAALSSVGMLLLSLLVLGPSTFRAFLDILPFYASAMTENRWHWNELASTFAAARHIGIPQDIALSVHTVLALAATALVWRAWRNGLEQRVPILASSTLLVPPYLLTYDALLLIVPIAWLVQRRQQPAVVALAWVFCLLPVATYFRVYPGPNTVPIAALLCLWALHRGVAVAPTQVPALQEKRAQA